MADFPGPIEKIASALNTKGVGSACPMCRQNKWMIQDEAPYSRTEVTDAEFLPHRVFKGFIPAYWLYCGNCGFIAQFMKSVVDDEGSPQREEAAG